MSDFLTNGQTSSGRGLKCANLGPYFVGVSNGPALELKGLPSAFAGLLSHCSVSGLVIQRKSEFQSDQPENRKSLETAEH
jgi:hypothetical protein